MSFINSNRIKIAFIVFLLGGFFVNSLSSKAASALAAWSISSNGLLQLRTSKGVKLEAFFKSSADGVGDRVWVDFPGELIRPRKIKGNGPIKEIRLGKPSSGFTRLVIEFVPSVELDPKGLKLIGTGPGKWKMNLLGLPKDNLKTIGEGNVNRNTVLSSNKRNSFISLDLSSLPDVPRDRYRIVIDPGHGGPDPGAVGIGGLRETDVVLDVSLRVSRFLSSKGVKTLLTRRYDRDLDLQPRVNKANNYRADAFVSIHANATKKGYRKDVNGMETYYYSGYNGLTLAKNIHRQILNASSDSPDRGVRKSRFFVIRKTTMPAVLVEIGFVTGRSDSEMLRQSFYRERLAFAIAKGILNYLRAVN